MHPEIRPDLDFELPIGEWLRFPDEPLPAEALRLWRLRRYLLWRQRDPEMKERPMPQGEPFVLE